MTDMNWPDALERPTPDWSAPLEDSTVVLRVNGYAHCPHCGAEYRRHEIEPRVTDRDGQPFLHRGCNGVLLKL